MSMKEEKGSVDEYRYILILIISYEMCHFNHLLIPLLVRESPSLGSGDG